MVVYFSCPLAILVTWLATRDNSDRNHWPMRLWLVAIAYIAWNVVPAIIVVTRKSTVMFIDLWAYAGITLGLIILVIYFWLVLREVKVTARLPDAGAKQN